MNNLKFFMWLQQFDDHIVRTPGRNVLLFVDNCSAHGAPTNLPELRHIRIDFLLKNTTSILQPVDLGVIAWIKLRYKQMIVQHAVDLIDGVQSEHLYKVDLRLAGMSV